MMELNSNKSVIKDAERAWGMQLLMPQMKMFCSIMTPQMCAPTLHNGFSLLYDNMSSKQWWHISYQSHTS